MLCDEGASCVGVVFGDSWADGDVSSTVCVVGAACTVGACTNENEYASNMMYDTQTNNIHRDNNFCISDTQGKINYTKYTDWGFR